MSFVPALIFAKLVLANAKSTIIHTARTVLKLAAKQWKNIVKFQALPQQELSLFLDIEFKTSLNSIVVKDVKKAVW